MEKTTCIKIKRRENDRELDTHPPYIVKDFQTKSLRSVGVKETPSFLRHMGDHVKENPPRLGKFTCTDKREDQLRSAEK